jgi:hypothetical protein
MSVRLDLLSTKYLLEAVALVLESAMTGEETDYDDEQSSTSKRSRRECLTGAVEKITLVGGLATIFKVEGANITIFENICLFCKRVIVNGWNAAEADNDDGRSSRNGFGADTGDSATSWDDAEAANDDR